MAESVLRFRVETADANAKIAHLTKKVQGLEVAVLKAGGTTRTAGTGFKAFGSGAQAAAVGAKGLGAALGAALGPITAVAAAAGSLGQVFGVLSKQDFAEAKVRSLGVDSKELTGRLKDVSRELSGQASVVELTGAAYDVASAGFNDAASASKILKAASLGATGGFSDINTVADATTSVLNAYGMEADKASKLVDGFIQTQNDGKIVIGEYAANIAKVAPVAAAVGVPLEEVNAAVAQITAGGQGAEVTFTALKTAFAQVAAGKVGQEFKKFGVQINAATLKSDGLAGTLEKIKKSGADAGTVIKAFGTEAGPSILSLLNDTEKYNKLLENQKQAQDTAAKAAFQASDTINGQLKRLQTAFSNLFSDQSELGVLLKETFKVAAVTVEVFAVAVGSALAPIRAIFALVNQVGQAISKALGMEGVNAAFELEKGFQSILKTASQVQAFVIGFGAQVGKVIGGVYARIINGGKGATNAITGFFRSALEKIVGFIKFAYNLIPAPIRKFLEGGAAMVQDAVGGFVQDTIALGQGFAPGAGTQAGTPEAANGIVATGGALGSGGTEDKDKEAEKAERIAQASAARVASLQNQTLLASALNAEERQQFERQIQINELAQNKKGLTDEQLRAEMEALTALFAQQDATKQLLEDKKKLEEQDKRLADKQKKAAENMQKLYADIGTTIKDSVVDGITGAIQGTKKLKDVAMDLMNKLLSKLIDFAINAALFGLGGMGSGGGLLGGLFKFGGGQAAGGPVSGGTTYMVGERGPELFTPKRSGTIIPNHALTGNSNITVNVDATGSSVEGNAEDSKRLGEAIGIAIRTELIKQKRPGGLLS